MLKSFGVRCIVVGGLLFVLAVSFFIWYFGSLSLALAYIEGKPFEVLPKEVDLGECPSESRHIAVFTITNLSSQPITIVGSEEGCSCIEVEKLPITIEPNKQQDLSIRAFVSGKKDYIQHVIIDIEVDKELYQIPVVIRASVLSNKSTDDPKTS